MPVKKRSRLQKSSRQVYRVELVHQRTIEIWTNEGFNTMFNGLRTDTNFLDLMDAGKKAKPASEEQTAGV